ncbi:MAG TPA: hypothetical protein VGN63_18450 [Flavisolibacter sp.]|nr:hypothetical protein [Flavisolibacter sp.]
MATQAFSKWVILLEFNRNRDFIAQNLCENKARPQLKCGGKCQLTKSLEKEEKGSSSSQSAKSGFAEILFVPATPGEQTVTVAALNFFQWPSFLSSILAAPPRAIFHPPA